MGYEVKGRIGEKTPQIKFTRRGDPGIPGTFFTGKKLAQKAIDKYTTVFEFELIDAHEKTPIVLSLGNEKYEDAAVGPGSKVSMFGKIDKEGRMDEIMDKLDQVPDGTTVKVSYLGMVQTKNGHTRKTFKVEVI